MTPELHPDVTGLAFLLGTWRGAGRGDYPTIDAFSYNEEVTFGHVGKPFLAYGQKTRDASTGAPLHAEVGYVRPVGPDRVELVLAQPSGVAEVDEGPIEGQRLVLESRTVALTSTAKSVTAVRREIQVADDVLRYTVDMAAVGHDLQFHIEAELHRI